MKSYEKGEDIDDTEDDQFEERAEAVRSEGDPSELAWTNSYAFGRGGVLPDGRHRRLNVTILNTSLGLRSDLDERLRLLDAAVARVDASRTLLLLPAGFFGYSALSKRGHHWTSLAEPDELAHTLSSRAARWPSSLLVAVGVDLGRRDQHQWWFAGGREGLCLDVARGSETIPSTPLADRIIEHEGFRLMGFVCGEVYEQRADELSGYLEGIDLVAVSAHVQVNRIWSRAIDPSLRRWSFHRRFQWLSSHCGAALAQSRGRDTRYVVNCDNWFVHRGELPFPGDPYGHPLQ